MRSGGTPGKWKNRPLWSALALSVCLVGSGFARLWYQRQIAQLGRRCQELEAEELALGRRLAVAQARVAQLQTPAQARRGGGEGLALPAADRLVRVSRREVRQPEQTLSAMKIPAPAGIPVRRR